MSLWQGSVGLNEGQKHLHKLCTSPLHPQKSKLPLGLCRSLHRMSKFSVLLILLTVLCHTQALSPSDQCNGSTSRQALPWKWGYCHLPPLTCHLHPFTCHLPPTICNLTSGTCHLPSSTYHLEPTIWHMPPAT